MESTKKIYIIVGVLVLAVLAVFLVLLFTKSSPDEEKPKVSSCPEHITHQGVVYGVVEIGGQCWLADNLRATSYRDGTIIPNMADSDEWEKDKEGAYICYYNQEGYCQEYGALYNWYAVDNEGGLCPEDWSVPTDERWAEMDDYMFKVVFAGFRNSAGPFDFLDEKGLCWSSTPSSGDFAYARVLEKNEQGMRRIESSKSSGFSVRCVQDYNME